MAMLSNAKSYRQISSFVKVHYKTLDKDFCLNWKKPPSYSTVRNIIKGADHGGLERCLLFPFLFPKPLQAGRRQYRDEYCRGRQGAQGEL